MTDKFSELTGNKNKVKAGSTYLRFAAVCAFISALTTIAIHNINIPSGSFDESVFLYNNNNFLLLNWIIMFHCLLVLLSMLGVSLVIEKDSRALAILGFIFISLFVFSEWERTLNTLWHINALRKKYATTVDENTLQFLRFEIQHRLFQSNVYFLLFTIGFSFGNACYGFSMINNIGIDRYLGAGLLLWFCFTTCAFVYDFYPSKWMATIVDACNKYYQPFIRTGIAYWLFQKAKST